MPFWPKNGIGRPDLSLVAVKTHSRLAKRQKIVDFVGAPS